MVPALEESERDGQFDVLMDGRVVASRGGGVLARFLGTNGAWPDEERVVDAVRARLGRR